MVDYSERLKHALTSAGLSTQQFADRLGVSYHAVRKVLHGESKGFSAENHSKACAILQINPDWLALGKGDQQRHSAPHKAEEPHAPYNINPTPTPDQPASAQLSQAIALLQNLPAAKLAQAHSFLTFLTKD